MRHLERTATILVTGLLAMAGVKAQDAPVRPWSNAAELGVVVTSGNAEGTNFALGNKFKYAWTNAELTCDLAALRNESTTRTVTNPPPYGTPVVTDTTAVTAASYALAAKYRRNITERMYWYVGASWYQNFFAGIDDRYILGGGIGYTFVRSDRHLLKGEVGLDLTKEDPLGDPPPAQLETIDYVGARATLNYELKIGEKSKLAEDLNFIENLDTTGAWRANSLTSLTAAMNDRLALKLSYLVMYSNEPPVKVIPADPGPGPDAIYTFETTDTILTAALVVNF